MNHNAVFNATGVRVTRLPIKKEDLVEGDEGGNPTFGQRELMRRPI